MNPIETNPVYATPIDPNIAIAWAIFGLLAGAIAKLLMPGKDPGGLITTALLGIAGAFLGNFIYFKCTNEPFPTAAQLSLFGFFLSVGGGLLLLFGYRILFGQRR